MGERCEVCDREGCLREKQRSVWFDLVRDRDAAGCAKPDAKQAYRVAILAEKECRRHAVDWRTRCLAAETMLRTAQHELDVTRDAWMQAVRAGDLVRARLDAAVAECERNERLTWRDIQGKCLMSTDYVVGAYEAATAILAALKGE